MVLRLIKKGTHRQDLDDQEDQASMQLGLHEASQTVQEQGICEKERNTASLLFQISIGFIGNL